MKQPFKFLPYFEDTGSDDNKIARFKGLSINCRSIGKSWELSAEPGKQSIVAEGDTAGMELQSLVENMKGDLVGKTVYSFYGGKFPLNVKLVDLDDKLAVEIGYRAGALQKPYKYYLVNQDDCHPASATLVSGPCFSVCKEEVNGQRILTNPCDSFMGLLCIKGEGSITVDGVTSSVKKGETLLLPASVNKFGAQGVLAFLTIVAHVPG